MLFRSYKNYLNEVSKILPKDVPVLANLNTEYYFDNGKLFDYRNLAFLKDYGLSFYDYIKQNNIKYIIYPEEMDYIYRTRPTWYGLYGNLVYYGEMQSFFDKHCRKVYTFRSETYGIRISELINKKSWKVVVYQVLD